VLLLGGLYGVGDAARLDTGRTRAGSNGTIHLNFRDADILQIVDLMSELTGKNFLVDDKVRGKVTIIAPQPVTVDEAYQVFLSILEIQGFTIVPQGPIIKIIPTRDVKDSPIPTTTDPDYALPATSDAFVTQLIPLQYADANEIRGLLSPLVSRESSMLAYTPTNTLILTETFSNLTRLRKIIDALDIEAPAATLKVRPLEHAAAEQLASAVQSALEALAASSRIGEAGAPAAPPTPQQRRSRAPTPAAGQPGSERGPRIIPDPRTNSLVLIATREDIQTAENIISQLDIPTPEGRGQIHVYYLAHAKAEELAQVLTAQASELAQATTPGQPGDAGTPLRGGAGTGTRPGTLGTRTTAPGTRTGVTTGTTPSGITITADKPTNSLVITAPPEAYAILKEIIQKLDIRRAQVLVEGLIAEVTFQKTINLGVEWRVIDEPNGLQVFGSSTGSESTGLLNTLTTNPLTGLTTPGFLIGALRNTISINGTDIANIPVILRAFQGDTDVNILSTPNLLTTDNEEAEIIIGEERPFLRSEQDTPSGGIVSTSRTFEFRDTGITLRITPQISQGRTVRLQLFLEVTRFISESEVGAVTTTKRTARTTLIVDDSQTIVIGGLLQDDNNDAKTQVPCLGNVPVLGWAFKQSSSRRGKTNLLIFITPHIVTSPEDVERVTTHKRLQSDKALEIQEKLREGQPQDNLELLLN
jgi:general secretion pathway protein D